MSCRRVLRLLLALAAVLCVAPVGAVAGCIAGSSPGDSAINQYCETIPSSTGPQTTGPGSSPTLGATLPRRILGRVVGHGSGLGHGNAGSGHLLLTLPAPPGRVTTQHRIAAASTDPWSPFSAVLIALGGIALLLVVVRAVSAAARRRSSD